MTMEKWNQKVWRFNTQPETHHIYLDFYQNAQSVVKQHLLNIPLGVESNQVQHSYLPDWPNGKPT